MKPTWLSDDGQVKLWRGDCLTVLPTLPPLAFQAMITDPPYGINHSSSHGASWQNTSIAGDADTTTRDAVLRGVTTAAVHGTWKTPPISDVRGVLVWDKGPASGMGDLSFPWKPSWEVIYIRGPGWTGRRDEGVLRGPTMITWETKGRLHPHQKPVWIAEHLIGKLPNARTICDPFMGVGGCAIACIRLGRPFIGIELDPAYFDDAVSRVKAALKEDREQPTLFDLKPEKPTTPTQTSFLE